MLTWSGLRELPRLSQSAVSNEGSHAARVAAGGPGFVVVGTDTDSLGSFGVAWTSPDAVIWTEHVATPVIADGMPWAFALASSGQDFVTVGPAGMWRSVDGASWEPTLQPPKGAATPIDIAWGSAGYVAIGQVPDRSGQALTWSSLDGRAWTTSPPGAIPAFCPARIAGRPDGYVAVGSDCAGRTARPVSLVSVDGLHWRRSPQQASLAGQGSFDGQGGFDGVTAGGPGWIAFGSFLPAGGKNRGTQVWNSPDGLHWQRTSFLRPVSPYVCEPLPGYYEPVSMQDLVRFGPGYVAVGQTGCNNDPLGAAWISPDGATWRSTARDPAAKSPSFGPMWSVAVRGNVLVAAGDTGYIDEWPAVYVATLGP